MSNERLYEPVREEALREITHSGKTYTNEARSMAYELLERRAKDPKSPETMEFDWSGMYTP